ncbi:MAG TPA: methyltransferase domain-containing protein [Verrucomicrobiota bacterium]|nr:methyltransferase domain-containing protein [Verrucomicrobiota bacterium]
MSYLLFPGRHLVNTRFQEAYLRHVLTTPPSQLPGLSAGRGNWNEPPAEIIFAITSANQENSRFNPIPFHVRAMGVDRFARELRQRLPFRFRVLGIPHYGHTQNFAEFTIKEIANQSEHRIRLTPENCLVICSTPEVSQLYRALGFAIAPAEAAEPNPKPTTPIELIREIGASGSDWKNGPLVKANLAPSHIELFGDLPEVPQRIARLYQDPLTNQDGSLTASRNYSTYARGMNEIIRLKYLDIRDGIKPGRIVDEGCADGALLAEISRDFPDSDLFGIDLSSEFAGRFHERQRAGEFGGAYVHFFHRNLFDRIFEPDSIDTTICNSTLHEIWSYGEGEKSVRRYLAEKLLQLRPGGRLIIRDVIGPEDANQEVLLWCSDADGQNLSPAELARHPGRETAWLQKLSTRSRFNLFARDFLGGKRPFSFTESLEKERLVFRLTLRQAAEFLSKKDYTDNWKSEMNEEFCFWSFPQWKSVLSEIGFAVCENPNETAAGSRVYTNSWITQHRYEGRVNLFDTAGTTVPWPPTNLVLLAQKPMI